MTPISDPDWPCGWREHEQQQLERWARVPFAQKLQWLEDAHRMVIEMQKTRPSINAKGEYLPATESASTREDVVNEEVVNNEFLEAASTRCTEN